MNDYHSLLNQPFFSIVDIVFWRLFKYQMKINLKYFLFVSLEHSLSKKKKIYKKTSLCIVVDLWIPPIPLYRQLFHYYFLPLHAFLARLVWWIGLVWEFYTAGAWPNQVEFTFPGHQLSLLFALRIRCCLCDVVSDVRGHYSSTSCYMSMLLVLLLFIYHYF